MICLGFIDINDLLDPVTAGYADDSTVTETHLSKPKDSRVAIPSLREALMDRTNLTV